MLISVILNIPKLFKYEIIKTTIYAEFKFLGQKP